MATLSTLGTTSLAISAFSSLLAGYGRVVREINDKCHEKGLPPAFLITSIGDGLIQGNDLYRFEGFGLSFASIIPLKPQITFWVHYKSDSPEHQSLGVFGIPINLAQASILDILRGVSLNLGGINVEETISLNSSTFSDGQGFLEISPQEIEPKPFTVLKKNSIDELGASRYQKSATAPGSTVANLQKNLNLLGGEQIEVDGWFGDNTEKSLKAFQKAALEHKRFLEGRNIKVTPSYEGIVSGEYDALTAREMELWLNQGYKLSTASLTPGEDKKFEDNRWLSALAKAPISGASNATAASDRLISGGIEASYTMARTDLPAVQPLLECFRKAGELYNIPSAILAAIASRESRCGKVLRNGWGDNNNAFGIMQIDKRYHTLAGTNTGPASQEHINQAAGILFDYLRQVQAKHPSWEDEYILKGAVAAYNFGVRNVQTKAGIDRGTANNDYGSDVLARAQFYARHMGKLPEAIPSITPPSGDDDIQLSPHFKLSEMIRSETAARHGINNNPKDAATIENLKALSLNALEPIRTHFGKAITPTSGYRSPEVNKLVGGVQNSQHLYGEAVDFVVPGHSIQEVISWAEINIDYDQLINEFGRWIHLSYKRNGHNRKQSFRL